jgi:hypothetical protein
VVAKIKAVRLEMITPTWYMSACLKTIGLKSGLHRGISARSGRIAFWTRSSNKIPPLRKVFGGPWTYLAPHHLRLTRPSEPALEAAAKVGGMTSMAAIKGRVVATTTTRLVALVNPAWRAEDTIVMTALLATFMPVLLVNRTYLKMDIGGTVPVTGTGIMSIAMGSTLGLQRDDRGGHLVTAAGLRN